MNLRSFNSSNGRRRLVLGGVAVAACLLAAVFGCSSRELSPDTAKGGVRSVTIGIHTNCPYGLVA